MKVLVAGGSRASAEAIQEVVQEYWLDAEFTVVACAGDAITQIRLSSPDLVITELYLAGWRSPLPALRPKHRGHVPTVGTGLDVANGAAFYETPCILVSEEAGLDVPAGTSLVKVSGTSELRTKLRAALANSAQPAPPPPPQPVHERSRSHHWLLMLISVALGACV